MIFETMAWQNNRIRHWDLHYARYTLGCKHYSLTPVSADTLYARIACLSLPSHSVIRLQHAQDTVTIEPRAWPEYPSAYYIKGINATICTSPADYHLSAPGIKAVNRKPYEHANLLLADKALQEVFVLDKHGCVVEGTKTNIFAVIDGMIATPALTSHGVPGTMRQAILDYCTQHSIPYDVRPILSEELDFAEHIFISNAIIGIWPVARLGNKPLTPGRHYRQLTDGMNLSHGTC